MFIKRIYVVLLVLAAALVLFLGSCNASSDPTTVRMGIQPWIGYGPWWIAQEKGLFEKHGLEVELVTFVEDKEINAALASGDMHAANFGNYQAINLFNSGLDIRVILLQDTSYQADAILAGGSIGTVEDLGGMKVAYEEGTVSDVLLNYALQQHNMTLADIQPVFMPAANAGAALMGGQVDAAVTYEPYISAALSEDNELKVIYSAAERPGLITDVFAVNAGFLTDHPETARALLRVWDEAVSYYRSNPEDAKAIIARRLDSDVEELATAFDGIELFDLADNRRVFENEFRITIEEGAVIAASIGLLEGIPDLDILLDSTYLSE